MSQGGAGDQAGERLGSGVKGVFQAIHGAGEAIRGTINSGLDGVGDGIAQRESGSVQSKTEPSSENHGTTYQQGIDELKQGISNVTGDTSGAGRVGTDSSPAGPNQDATDRKV